MKKAVRKIVSLLLAVTMIFGVVGFGISEIDFEDFAVKASATEEIPTSGVCGNNAKWLFDFGSGTLTISGKGEIGFEDSGGSYFFLPGDYEYKNYVEKVIIEQGITEIGARSFYGFKSMRSITIPSSVTSIGDDAFGECESLTSVTIPSSVTSIGDRAFEGCSNISSFDIPASVEVIGTETFAWCNNLINIYVESASEYYSSDEYGVLFNKEKTELIQYPIGNSRTSYVIPGGITTVSESAFYNCNYLTDITFPQGIKFIYDNAFRNCDTLTQITIPSSLKYLGDEAFSGCDSLMDITLYDGIENFGKNVFVGTGYYDNNFKDGALYIGNYLAQVDSEESEERGVVEIRQGTKVIANGAFYFDDLTCITIPSSMEIIGEEAFYRCDSLVNITIPEGVKSVGEGAFQWCESLEYVHLPSTLSVISDKMFYNCIKLTSVNLNSITDIGEWAFADCESLTAFDFTKTTKSIGNAAFYGCENLTDVNFAGDVSDWCQIEFEEYRNCLMENAERVFFNGEEVFDIVIPYGVTKIGRNAFYGNDKITSVTISETVVEIGYGAFNCTNLENVYFEGSVSDWCNINIESEIPKEYLYISGKLVKDYLVIPEDVFSIGDYAFSNCKNITGVIFEGNTEKIGKNAFYQCYSLESVVLPKSMKYIGDDAFAYTPITDIYIPAGVEYLNRLGAYGLTFIEVDASNKRYSSDEFGVLFNKSKTELIEFPSSSLMTSYNIPQSVYKIRSRAFGSDALKNIYIPEGVAIIEDVAFIGCYGLAEICIPSTVSYIGNQAFAFCENLERISIRSEIVYIGSDVFEDTKFYNDEDSWEYDALYIDEHLIKLRDSSAEEYVVLNGTKSIAYNTFNDYSSIKELTIPLSVQGISEKLTYSNTLTEINYEGSIDDWLNIGFLKKDLNPYGILVNFNCSAYESDIKFTYTVDENLEVAINDFIGQIDGSLVIPDTIDGYPVTSIGELAFSYLNMDEVIFNCTHLETIGDGAFTGCASLTEVTIPDGVTSIGASGFSYNDNLITVNIPESVEVIGESCFEYNTNLQYVNWDTATLTEIEESTFEGCALLEEITIPSTVTHIGDYSFAYCENLIVNINDAINLIEIGDYAFTGCASLTEVTIPDGVTSIGASGFSYNDNLTTVNIPESVEVIGESCFEYNTNLQYVNWGTAVLTEIKESTFEGCAVLEEITIPPSVTHIDDYGFAYCSNLVSVCINDAIIEIGNYAFKDCVKIEGTQILYGEIGPGYSVPNDVKSYEMVLPYGLKKIGNSAFENCVSIKKLTIPDTVTTIGDSAFKSCTGIQSVNYTGTGMKWNTIDIQPNNSTLYADNITFMGKIIKTPSTTTIEYGETLYLHINADGLPNGAKIEWSTDSNAVSLKPATDGKSCGVTSVENGDAVITVKIADQNGNSVTDGNGDEISSTQKITSKAGLWQKIVSFFKNLFGISRIIEQRIKF